MKAILTTIVGGTILQMPLADVPSNTLNSMIKLRHELLKHGNEHFGREGRDWNEENDVIGTIGRSTGELKVPLLVSLNDIGGPALSENTIVRIIDVDTFEELYRHPKYHSRKYKIVEEDGSNLVPGYPFEVWRDEGEKFEVMARFSTMAKACHYIAFMDGLAMNAPTS